MTARAPCGANKKVDTVVNALNECWNLAFEIAVGYYADNGMEFKNVKMNELVSKLGISISYGRRQLIVHGPMGLMRGIMHCVISQLKN